MNPKIGETTGEALPSPLSEHSPKAANRPPSPDNNKDKALFGFIAVRFLTSLGKGFSVCQLLCISLADISCRGRSAFHWRSYLSGERLTHDRQTRLNMFSPEQNVEIGRSVAAARSGNCRC